MEDIFQLGKVHLTKCLVPLSANGQYCNSCHSSDCVHHTAYQDCLPFITLETINVTYIQNTPCYIIDCLYIVLLDTNFSIHIYRNVENKWFCESCEKVCKLKFVIQNIPQKILHKEIKNPQPRLKPELHRI